MNLLASVTIFIRGTNQHKQYSINSKINDTPKDVSFEMGKYLNIFGGIIYFAVDGTQLFYYQALELNFFLY